MKGVFTILKRFLPPYKKYAVLIFIFNAFTAIFSIFHLSPSFLFCKFFLKSATKATILFLEHPRISFTKLIQNNGYWYITHLVESCGASTTLLWLAIWLMFITLFKTGTAYFGSYFIVPIRTGIVRDIRNNLNDKILSLPIGFSEERKR